MRTFQEQFSRKKFFIWLFIVALAAFVLGLNMRNFFPIATVNGRPIKRDIFASRLVRSSGAVILNELIIQELVFQEAEKRRLNVSKKELTEYRKNLEKQLSDQNINLAAAISQQGKTEKDFERELKAQLLAEKMFGGNIQVTDKDINNYFIQNNIVKGNGAILESQLLSIRKLVSQQKLREAFSKWLLLQQKTAKVKVLLNF